MHVNQTCGEGQSTVPLPDRLSISGALPTRAFTAASSPLFAYRDPKSLNPPQIKLISSSICDASQNGVWRNKTCAPILGRHTHVYALSDECPNRESGHLSHRKCYQGTAWVQVGCALGVHKLASSSLSHDNLSIPR